MAAEPSPLPPRMNPLPQSEACRVPESTDSWANDPKHPACFLNGITYSEMWSKVENGSSERKTPIGSRNN